MKYFFTTIFLCFTLTSAYAQPCVQGLVSTFQKIAGGVNDEIAQSVIETSDGGYLVVGKTKSYGVGGYDFFAHKLSYTGTTQWFKTYGNSNDQLGSSIQVIETTDSAYVIAGREIVSGSHDAIIFKIDASGNFLWKRRFLKGGNDYFIDIIEDQMGNYVGVGSAVSSNSSCFISKISSSGGVINTKVFNKSGNQHLRGVIEASNGEYIVVGQDNALQDGLIMRIDTSLNILWAKNYQTNGWVFFNSIAKSNNGYVVVGSADLSSGSKENLLLEINDNGVEQWNKVYATSSEERGMDVQVANSEIIFTSSVFDLSSDDIICVKTDSVGNIIWNKSYGGLGIETTEYFNKNLEITSDNGLIIVGKTTSFGAGQEDVYIIKANECGDSYCNDTSIVFTSSVLSLNAFNYFVSTVVGSGINTSAYTSNNHNVVETFLCQDTIPQCQILVDFNADTVCIGDSTHFMDLSFDLGYNIVNWQWNFGDGNSTVGIQNPSHIYSSPGIYQTTLIVTNDSATGCVDSITKTVVVNNLPIVDAGVNQSLCDSGLVVLGGNPTGPIGSDYLWTPNNGTLDDDTISNPTATVNTSTIYYVTVTDTNGCSNKDSIALVIFSSPLLQITDDTTLCKNDTLLLNATNNINYSYSWTPAYNLSNTTIYNPMLIADSSLTYYLIVTDTTTGCSSSDSINIGIHSLNMFSNVSDNFEICDGDEVLVSIPSEYTVLWQDSSTLNNYVINQIGTYHVIAYHQCRIVSDTFLVDVKQCNCEYYIPNVITNNGDDINDVFNVSMSSEESCNVVSMQIFNRWGQTIFESNFTNPTWNGRTNAGDAVPEGTYFYIIEIEVSVDGVKETEVKKGYLTLFR